MDTKTIFRDYVSSLPDEQRTKFVTTYQQLDDAGKKEAINRVVSASKPSVKHGINVPLGQTGRGEEQIAQRPSVIKSIIDRPITGQSFQQHPFIETLRGVGAGFEGLEGTAANIMLAAQRGRLQEAPADIAKMFRGERPAQYGDVMREAGAPEWVSATTGVLAGGAKIAPETLAMKAVGKAASPVAKGVIKIVKDKGIDTTANVLGHLSNIKPEQVRKAIENPQMLSKSWLKKEGSAVQSQYKNVVEKLEQDSKNVVDTTSLQGLDVVPKEQGGLGLLTRSGEWSKDISSMSGAEKARVLKWVDEINKSNKLTFNRVEGIKSEIDRTLGKFFKGRDAANVRPITGQYERTALDIRDKLNQVLRSQYPEAGKVLDRYSTYKTAETIYKNFDKWTPRLSQVAAVAAIPAALGGNLPAFGGVVLSTIPKAQALGILGMTGVGRNIGTSGAILPKEAFRQFLQGNQ